METSIEKHNADVASIFSAIYYRIGRQHEYLFQKYGSDTVWDFARMQAEYLADVGIEEIGSSDVSIWVKDVISSLKLVMEDY